MRVKAPIIEITPAEQQIMDKILGKKIMVKRIYHQKRKHIGFILQITKEAGKYYMNLSIGVVTQ